MKKAIAVVASITILSLLCVIGFGIAAVAMGLPFAMDRIDRYVDFKSFVPYVNVGEIVSETIGVITVDDFVADQNQKESLDFQNEFLDLNGITKITIDVDAAKVEIKPITGDIANITVKSVGNTDYKRSLKAQINGKTAVIESHVNNFSSITLNRRTTVLIELPVKNYDTLAVSLNAGDLSLDSVTCDDFSLKLNAGNMDVKNITAKRATLDSNAGNIEVKDIFAKTLEIDNDAGQVVVHSAKGDVLKIKDNAGNVVIKDGCTFSEEIEASVNMGNIDIKLSRDVGFTLSYNTTMGRFENSFNGEITQSKRSEGITSREGTFTYGDGSCKISLKADMGNITIQ